MKTIAILTLMLGFPLVYSARAAQAGRATEPGNQMIDKFESHEEPAIRAFLRLAAIAKVPLGVIRADGQICTDKVEVNVEKTPMINVLDLLTRQTDRYIWMIDEGVVVVQPKQIPISTAQLLDTLIPRFAAPRTTLEGLGLFLTIDLRAVFRPEVGSASSLSRSPATPLVGPLEMHNVTLRDSLNAIVTQGSGGQWVLRPTPDDYRKAADTKFVDIINYAENPLKDIQALSCSP